MLKERHRIFVSLLACIDTAVLIGSVASAWLLTVRLGGPPTVAGGASWVDDAASWRDLLLQPAPLESAAVALPALLLAMIAFGLYRPRRDRSFDGEVIDLGKATLVGGGVAILLLQLVTPAFRTHPLAPTFAMVVPVCAFTALAVERYIFRVFLRAIRERGWNQRHMAIVGTGRLGQMAFQTFTSNGWTGIACAYFVSHHDRASTAACLGRPVRGGLDELEATLEEHPVDGVILALPHSRAHLVPTVLLQLSRFPVEVSIIPDVSPRYLPINLAVTQLEGMPILSVRQFPLNGYGAAAKRALDLLVGTMALVFFAPAMLAIAAVIKLQDGGSVLYSQIRAGMGGKPFRMLKFRTMKAGAAESHAHGDGGAPPRGSEAWTRRDDPRITPMGRWLRRLSLDELPQLFNVLKGDMSLVGPRPERVELMLHFRDDRRGYMLRQNIKAGMTGWAQINGLRGDTSMRKRLQYDLYYIRHWSVWFDLQILFLTLFRGFRHPNAH